MTAFVPSAVALFSAHAAAAALFSAHAAAADAVVAPPPAVLYLPVVAAAVSDGQDV